MILHHFKMFNLWKTFKKRMTLQTNLVLKFNLNHGTYHIMQKSYAMREPVLCHTRTTRHRSACASAQSDQHLCCSLPRKYKPEISRLYLASVAEQTGLSLSWLHTSFLMAWLKYIRKWTATGLFIGSFSDVNYCKPIYFCGY